MQPSGCGAAPTSGWHYRAAEMCPGMGTGQLLPSSSRTTGPVPHVGHGPLSVGMLLEGHPQLDPQPAVMLSAVKQPWCKRGCLLGCCSMLPGFLQGSLSCQEPYSRKVSWPCVLHRPTRRRTLFFLYMDSNRRSFCSIIKALFLCSNSRRTQPTKYYRHAVPIPSICAVWENVKAAG